MGTKSKKKKRERDQGKEQTETRRRDSNPPAKKKTNIQSRITSFFSVSYKSFADTDAFFPQSRFFHSLSLMSVEVCVREKEGALVENSIKNLLLKR